MGSVHDAVGRGICSLSAANAKRAMLERAAFISDLPREVRYRHRMGQPHARLLLRSTDWKSRVFVATGPPPLSCFSRARRKTRGSPARPSACVFWYTQPLQAHEAHMFCCWACAALAVRTIATIAMGSSFSLARRSGQNRRCAVPAITDGTVSV